METVADSKLHAVLALYDMQTDFFKRALDGISDDDAHNRLGTKANHIAWLAGALVEQRFDLARAVGIDKKQQADELFSDNRGIQDGTRYPPLESYRADWEAISPEVRAGLTKLTEEDLAKRIEMGPDFSMSLYEVITFTSYREANMIGQIALYRRLLGYPAMSYM